MRPLPKRSKSRITQQGLLYERRLIALRRLQAQQVLKPLARPEPDEIANSERRWRALRHLIP